MDLGKRQLLQQALERAIAEDARVLLTCTEGRTIVVQPDFICYENHVEATDVHGQSMMLPYADIVAVRAVGKPSVGAGERLTEDDMARSKLGPQSVPGQPEQQKKTSELDEQTPKSGEFDGHTA